MDRAARLYPNFTPAKEKIDAKAVIDSLARLGHATTRDGRTFELRRIA